MYKLTQPNDLTNQVEYIIRLSDHTFIPKVDGNRDYQEYLEWTKASPMNVAEEAE